MAVLRKYNPATEQWEILQGGVQGLQGPPVALSKGTVTTGAPGTNADFTVTGTPPNQKLSLTIPRGEKGDTGNPSTYLIVGPGRPDTPSTTGGTITGSEPVGAEYRSTDGANVGAHVWRKVPAGYAGRVSAGWVVTDGDTGAVSIEPWLTSNWAVNTIYPYAYITLQAGGRVSFRACLSRIGTGGGDARIVTLPLQWASPVYEPLGENCAHVGGTGRRIESSKTGDMIFMSHDWIVPSTQGWPTTLSLA